MGCIFKTKNTVFSSLLPSSPVFARYFHAFSTVSTDTVQCSQQGNLVYNETNLTQLVLFLVIDAILSFVLKQFLLNILDKIYKLH